MSIKQKYQTKAAALYRDKVRTSPPGKGASLLRSQCNNVYGITFEGNKFCGDFIVHEILSSNFPYQDYTPWERY